MQIDSGREFGALNTVERSAADARAAARITTPAAGSARFALLTFALACAGAAFADMPQRLNGRPNIVLILSDDLGYGDPSSYGDKKVLTPNIDELAREGMRFTDAHSPSSVCTPTRYGLLTGRYGWRTWNGTKTLWADDPLLIETNRLTLPRLLHQFNYRTAIIGKWHLGFGAPGAPGWDDINGPDYNKKLAPGPLEVGFDYFFGIPHTFQQPHVFIENHQVVGLESDDPIHIVLDRRWQEQKNSYLERLGTPDHRFRGGSNAQYKIDEVGAELTSRAVRWIESQKQEPFFLYFAHPAPHAPIVPNARFKNVSKVGPYGDLVTELDWSVGEILKALSRQGLSNRTMVVFTSDNGGVTTYREEIAEVNGHKINGPFFGQKGQVYEGANRVPFVVKWPGMIVPGRTTGALVSLTDLFATVADMLDFGVPPDAAEDSFSFLHVLRGVESTKPVRKSLILDSWNGVFGIRQGPWKLIFSAGGGSALSNAINDSSIHRLYNLDRDPGETMDVSDRHPALVVCLSWSFKNIQFSGRSRSLSDPDSRCEVDAPDDLKRMPGEAFPK